MKKLLLSAVAVLLALGAGFASASHYQKYQTNKQQEEAEIARGVADIERQRQEQAAAKEVAQAKLVETLRTECRKGKVAYDRHTALIKTKLEVPNCDAAQ